MLIVGDQGDVMKNSLALRLSSIILMIFSVYYTLSMWHILVFSVIPKLSYLESLNKSWLGYVQIIIMFVMFGLIIFLSIYAAIDKV